MHTRHSLIACLLVFVAAPLFADTIDGADANSPGIPIAQVQDALPIQFAALSGRPATASPTATRPTTSTRPATATRPATTTRPVTATASRPAATVPATAAALNFNGPRADSPLYDDLVFRYLAGDWTTLTADLAAKQKEIAALAAGNRADLIYIQQTLAECRPPWWNLAKTGKASQFTTTVWKQSVTANYTSGPEVKFNGAAVANGKLVFNLVWPADIMDSRDPISMLDMALNIPGDHGFVRGDALASGIWSMLGASGLYAQMGPAKIQALTPDEKKNVDRYVAFVQDITSAYYAAPPARRLACIQGCASFETAMNDQIQWITRRPLGAALLIEFSQHRDRYNSVHIESILGIDKIPNPADAECFLAKPLVLQLLDAKLTLEEDRHLRDVIKTLAEVNPNWNTTKLKLENNLQIDLDPGLDAPCAAARVAFLKSALATQKSP
jgi:hypothetical protein